MQTRLHEFTTQLSNFDKKFKSLVDVHERLLPEFKKSYKSIKPWKLWEGAKISLQGYELKKKTSDKIVNDTTEILLKTGLENGAMAGKVLGAGGGGYVLFIVNPEKRKSLIDKLNQMKFKDVDFQIDYQGLDVRRIE